VEQETEVNEDVMELEETYDNDGLSESDTEPLTSHKSSIMHDF